MPCLCSCLSHWLCAIQPPAWIAFIHRSNQAEFRGTSTLSRLICGTPTEQGCINDSYNSCCYCVISWTLGLENHTIQIGQHSCVCVHLWGDVNEHFSEWWGYRTEGERAQQVSLSENWMGSAGGTVVSVAVLWAVDPAAQWLVSLSSEWWIQVCLPATAGCVSKTFWIKVFGKSRTFRTATTCACSATEWSRILQKLKK